MPMMINGQQITHISALDRGLQYGDGCFTTAHVINQNVLYFDFHIARLHDDCERLHFPETNWDTLAEFIAMEAFSLMRAETHSDLSHEAVLKIILTRAEGARGYSPLGCHHINRIISLTPYPSHYLTWQKTGIDVNISPIRLGHAPHIAGIKHLNRLDQVLIKRELEKTTFQDSIVLDSDGCIVEASASNIFWRKGDKIFTPDVTQCGINGLMRQRVIDHLNKSGFAHIEIVREPIETLQNADEVMLSNALMPLVPINHVVVSPTQSWFYSPLKREAWPYLFPQLLAGK